MRVYKIKAYSKVRDFKVSSDVIGMTHDSLVEHSVKSTGDIFDIQEVSRVASVTVNAARKSFRETQDELWNQLLGVLTWSIDVVSSCNYNWQSK